MKQRRLSLFTVSFALALAAFIPVAHATPIAWNSIDVTAHDEDGGAVILVTGTLPDKTALPAQVELAVPTGSQLQWAGEILGSDPSQDPSVEYTVATKDTLDIYSFTLTKARRGQLEIVAPAVFSTVGDIRSSALNWTTHVDVDSLSLYTRLPQTAQIVQAAEGAQSQPGESGYSYYGQTFHDVKAGKPNSLTFAFKVPASAPPSAPASQSGSAVIPIALLAVATVSGFFLVRGVNRKMKSRSAEANSSASPSTSDSTTGTLARGAAAESTPPSRRRVSPALVISGAVIVVAVVAGALAGGSSSSVQELPDGYAQEFSQGDECQSVTLRLFEPPTESTAQKLFAAIRPAEPLRAMAYKQNPRIEIGFCESTTNAQKIQTALAATGLTGEVVSP